MNTPHVSDYTMTFEGAGITYLFEYALGQYYWPIAALFIVKEGAVQEFVPNKTLAWMDEEGLRRSPEQVKTAVAKMRMSVTHGRDIIEKIVSAPLTRESVQQAFKACAEVMSDYYYFDPHFWDSTFEKAETDPKAKEVVEQVQAYKNVAREEFNSFYFGNGYLPRLLEKLSDQTSVAVSDLLQYDGSELLALFEGKSVLQEELINRKQAFVMIKNGSEITGYTGERAIAAANDFLGDAAIEPVREFKGRCAHKGEVIRGRVCNITRDYTNFDNTRREMEEMLQGDILVTQTTDPEMMPALRKAAAAVTDIGGLLSHTAIVARELNIPCIVDTKIASKILKTGDMVEVDAEHGTVRKI